MARRLAPALSHLSQLILATVPLFFVLCYFLVLAAKRPAKQYYHYQDDDVAFQYMGNADVTMIDLDYILYVFLAFFVLWVCGAVYIGIFVPKREQKSPSRKKIRKAANAMEEIADDPGLRPEMRLFKNIEEWEFVRNSDKKRPKD